MTGSEFKRFRVERNLSKIQLAHDLCVTVYTLDSWETDRRSIPLPVQKLFHLLYGIPFAQPQNIDKYDYVTQNTPELF